MEKIAPGFKGKLIKMIKDACGRLDDYSISLKTRQILLHWANELVENDFLKFFFFSKFMFI